MKANRVKMRNEQKRDNIESKWMNEWILHVCKLFERIYRIHLFAAANLNHTNDESDNSNNKDWWCSGQFCRSSGNGIGNGNGTTLMLAIKGLPFKQSTISGDWRGHQISIARTRSVRKWPGNRTNRETNGTRLTENKNEKLIYKRTFCLSLIDIVAWAPLDEGGWWLVG